MLCLFPISATSVLAVFLGLLLVWLLLVTITIVIVVVPIWPRFLLISTATFVLFVFARRLFVCCMLLLLSIALRWFPIAVRTFASAIIGTWFVVKALKTNFENYSNFTL